MSGETVSRQMTDKTHYTLPQRLTGTIRRFGARGAMTLWLANGLRKPLLMKVRSGSLPHPIWLRARTSDLDVHREIFVNEQYKHDFLAAPRVIVDVGANIGLSSIYFAIHYPNARILALEPEESNFRLLRKNVQYYKKHISNSSGAVV
jgi:hypothetical protein